MHVAPQIFSGSTRGSTRDGTRDGTRVGTSGSLCLGRTVEHLFVVLMIFHPVNFVSFKWWNADNVLPVLLSQSNISPGTCVPWEPDELLAQNPQIPLGANPQQVISVTVLLLMAQYEVTGDCLQDKPAKRGLVERVLLLTQGGPEYRIITSLPPSRHRLMQTCQASPSPPTSERFCQRLQASQNCGLRWDRDGPLVRNAYLTSQTSLASQKCLSNIPKCAMLLHLCDVSRLVKFDLGVYIRNKSGTMCSFSTRAILQLPVTLFFHIKAGIKDDQVDLSLSFYLITNMHAWSLVTSGPNNLCITYIVWHKLRSFAIGTSDIRILTG